MAAVVMLTGCNSDDGDNKATGTAPSSNSGSSQAPAGGTGNSPAPTEKPVSTTGGTTKSGSGNAGSSNTGGNSTGGSTGGKGGSGADFTPLDPAQLLLTPAEFPRPFGDLDWKDGGVTGANGKGPGQPCMQKDWNELQPKDFRSRQVDGEDTSQNGQQTVVRFTTEAEAQAAEKKVAGWLKACGSQLADPSTGRMDDLGNGYYLMYQPVDRAVAQTHFGLARVKNMITLLDTSFTAQDTGDRSTFPEASRKAVEKLNIWIGAGTHG
jgi:hypothetical protein